MQDIFVAKFDGSGIPIWVKGYGGGDQEFCEGMAVESSNSIIITGSFRSPTVNFDSQVVNNTSIFFSDNVFITKLDTSGTAIWAKSPISDSGSDVAFGVAVDNIGNSYLTGSFGSTQIIFDSYTLVNSFIFSDIFLVKYDVNGNIIWANSVGATGMDNGFNIYVESNDIFYLTGSYESDPIIMGNDTLPVFGSEDFFIAKYDSSGSSLWAKGFGGNGSDDIISLTSDSLGYLYLFIGSWSDSIDFDGTTLINSGGIGGTSEIFITKLDNNGQLLWDKQIHGIYDEQAVSINSISNTELIICGSLGSTITYFDTDSLVLFGSRDFFLAKIGDQNSSINETNAKQPLIWPNPCTKQFMFWSKNEQEVSIINNNGKLISIIKIHQGINKVDVSNLMPGIYNLVSETGGLKFIKIN